MQKHRVRVSYKNINKISYPVLFSSLGVLAYLLLINFSDLAHIGSKALFYTWGYLYFIAMFNLIGYSLIKFSNWLSEKMEVYMIKQWKLILLYSFVAVILLLLNYVLLATAKMIAGSNEPFIFVNSGHRILLIVWFIELIIIGLLLVNRSVLNSLRIQKEAARLQDENNRARYIALQNQLNPHFLFNSLNTLIAEIEYDPKNAIDFTRKLSDVYRYVLQCQHKPLVTLEEELEFMRAYIFLHQVRLGDYISVDCRIGEAYKETQLPPLTLQLLVENVIKHNSISAGKPMLISIYALDKYLIVSNTIHAKKSPPPSGTGLQNLANRYLLIMNKEIEIVKTDELFTIKLPLQYE